MAFVWNVYNNIKDQLRSAPNTTFVEKLRYTKIKEGYYILHSIKAD